MRCGLEYRLLMKQIMCQAGAGTQQAQVIEPRRVASSSSPIDWNDLSFFDCMEIRVSWLKLSICN